MDLAKMKPSAPVDGAADESAIGVMLFHVSEEPGIERFEPRPSPSSDTPVVWAIDEERLRNYLLPRECPRVTFYAGQQTTAADVERFLGSSTSVVAVEGGWLERIRSVQLYCFEMPPRTFACVDECAGYFVSREAVVPAGVRVVNDAVAALIELGVELRLLPNLWPLRDAVVSSTLQFSVIRMRNALPRNSGSVPTPVPKNAAGARGWRPRVGP
jgi:hypothetical protein